jgi:hypothetical protein
MMYIYIIWKTEPKVKGFSVNGLPTVEAFGREITVAKRVENGALLMRRLEPNKKFLAQ